MATETDGLVLNGEPGSGDVEIASGSARVETRIPAGYRIHPYLKASWETGLSLMQVAGFDELFSEPHTPKEIARKTAELGLSKAAMGDVLKNNELLFSFRWPAQGETEREITLNRNLTRWDRVKASLSGRPWKPGIGGGFWLG